MSEKLFDKYEIKGAYHWTEYHGPIHRLNAYTRARYDGILAALREHRLAEGSRTLDVGCGDGALAGLLADRFKLKVTGVDTTALAIELAEREFSRRKLAGDFRKVDGYRYPFENGSFAAVACCDVIEHVAAPKEMLHEMWRVLAPGGIVAISTPVRYTEVPLDLLHVQEWFPNEFRRLCEECFAVPVDLRLTHPVAWAELYASPSPVIGRASRLGINTLAKLGFNVFARSSHLRAMSTQTAIAVKPTA